MSDSTSQETTVWPAAAEHIVITPGVCGGRPRVAGHRITVQHIVLWHERGGMSPDEIASKYDLNLGDVYAALAYYDDHRAQVRAQIEADETFAAEMAARSPSLVRQKQEAACAQDNSLPS